MSTVTHKCFKVRCLVFVEQLNDQMVRHVACVKDYVKNVQNFSGKTTEIVPL
jgi:hypothetical protein